MTELDRIKFSSLMALLPLVAAITVLLMTFVLCKKTEKEEWFNYFKENLLWREFLKFIVFSFSIQLVIFPVIQTKEKDIWGAATSTIAIAAIIGYPTIIRPLILWIGANKYQQHLELESRIFNELNEKVKIRILKVKDLNAYVVSILPFSKIIMIGQPLLEELNDHELRCIIFHEAGHIKKKHVHYLLVLLFFAQVFSMIIYVQLTSLEAVQQMNRWIIRCLILGMLFVFARQLYRFVKKRMEFSADDFAAKYLGKLEYSSVLIKLDQIAKTRGMFSRNTPALPSLSDRLASIAKIYEKEPF